MPDLILHIAIASVPFLLIFIRRKISTPNYLIFFLIVLVLGATAAYFSQKLYGAKQTALGNNIDIGSLLIVGWSILLYVIILPIFIFYKSKNQ
ncbi:Uncharacterised protein [Chryseobacterium taklimakanense]|uniref:Uncharacterized protein n=1 Tax=Chryseobacterium taklimakanense TaxID=536441 RepID=A0A239XQG8_9FLAO|nr:hypothetical protein [Chryseobacterium taklimakanense]SNV48323.1 Uncharacterised protein [Chryseobacterium taklimakanense]